MQKLATLKSGDRFYLLIEDSGYHCLVLQIDHEREECSLEIDGISSVVRYNLDLLQGLCIIKDCGS